MSERSEAVDKLASVLGFASIILRPHSNSAPKTWNATTSTPTQTISASIPIIDPPMFIPSPRPYLHAVNECYEHDYF